MDRKPLKEQVIVVTGASTGLGRAVARGAGARGAKVVLAARNEEALANGVREVEHAGSEALAVPTDVTELAQVRRPPTAHPRRQSAPFSSRPGWSC